MYIEVGLQTDGFGTLASSGEQMRPHINIPGAPSSADHHGFLVPPPIHRRGSGFSGDDIGFYLRHRSGTRRG